MIPLRDLFRSALTRFLPGWLVSFALSSVLLNEVPTRLVQVGLLTMYTFAAVAGHAAALATMRRWLRSDSDVASRKSVVAGAASVGALLITSFIPHDVRGYALWVALYFAAAASITAAMYAPWVARQSALSERTHS